MKKIYLTQNKFTIVNDNDFNILNKYKWYLSSSGYAVRHPKMVNGIRKGKIAMHRIIIKAKKGEIVDHINRNTLDNRKKNLRIVNSSKNTLNSKLSKNNTSKIKGVVWHSRDKRWQARISIGGKRIQLGYFKNKLEAKKSYKLTYEKYFKTKLG